MTTPKIDRIQLNQMLTDGKPQYEIAEHFGVTEGAISKAKKELGINVAKNVGLKSAARVVDENLNTIQQLNQINSHANNLLSQAMRVVRGEEKQSDEQKTDARKIALDAMQEIRGQLRLQLEIFQQLFDMKAVQQFQEEVLNAIGSASPETREAILAALNERRAIHGVLEIS